MSRPQAKQKRRSRVKKDVSHVGRITVGALAGIAAAGLLAFFGVLWTPVQAADGSGTMTVAPESVVAGSTDNTLTFTFSADETMNSGGASLIVPAGWSPPQGTAGVAGYTAVESRDGMIADVEDTADALDGWAAGSGCSSGIAVDASVFHEGSGAIRCDTRGEDPGDVWYRNIPHSPQDWSTYTEVGFWIRSSRKFESDALVFVYSEKTDLGNHIERLAFPDTITANTWTYVNLRFASRPEDRRSIESYGFMLNSGEILDGASIWMDDLLMGPGTPTFPTLNSTRVRLLRLGTHQTMTITYGAGGGASGATAPSSPGVSTFMTRTRVSDAGRLTAIAVSPVVTVTAAVAAFQLTNPGDMTAGTRLAYTVSRVDQDGNPLTTGSNTVYLYTNSSGSSAHFYDAASGGSTVTSWTISPGNASVTFWYADDAAGSWTVSASDNATAPDGATGIDDATDAVTVSAPAAPHAPTGFSDPALHIPNEIEAFFEEGECSAEPAVSLHLHGHSVGWYRFGETQDLTNQPWLVFEGGLADQEFFFTEDGVHTVYFQFRSPAFLESLAQEVSIRVDAVTGCASPAHEHELENGHIVAPNLEEACVADFEHALLRPYLVATDGRTIRSGTAAVRAEKESTAETTYAFDVDGNGEGDVSLEVEHLTGNADILFLSSSVTGYAVRASVLAGDLLVEDIALWPEVSLVPNNEEKVISLDAYEQICSPEKTNHPHPGDLVQSVRGTRFYIAADFKRHPFPDDATFTSWYGADAPLRIWPSYKLAYFPMGQNVTLRPGLCVVDVQSVSSHFLIDSGNTLRRVLSDAVLVGLFGPGWPSVVRVIDAVYFGNYILGKNIAEIGQVRPQTDVTIDGVLGLPSPSSVLGEGHDIPSASP